VDGVGTDTHTCGSVRAVMQTDVGLVRDRNEDAAYVDPAGRFVILADGMGGHNAGDVASRMAVADVRASLEDAADDLAAVARAPNVGARDWIDTLLDVAVRRANDAVLSRARREPDKHGMGTTLEVVVVVADEAFIAHVGDSRTYLVRDGELRQTTADHTVARALVRAGTITRAQAETSPMRSVLANAVGIIPRPTIDHVRVALTPGDRLLVCSDGLYDYFEADELAGRLSSGPGEPVLAGLVDEARTRGGHDNITGIVVEVEAAAAAGDGAADAHPAAPLDDVATRPRSLARAATDQPPLADVGEQTLTSFVERALCESSRPHRLD
jgi:PPM family protein phosphatase